MKQFGESLPSFMILFGGKACLRSSLLGKTLPLFMILLEENLPPFMELYKKKACRRFKHAEVTITGKAAVPPHKLLY